MRLAMATNFPTEWCLGVPPQQGIDQYNVRICPLPPPSLGTYLMQWLERRCLSGLVLQSAGMSIVICHKEKVIAEGLLCPLQPQ